MNTCKCWTAAIIVVVLLPNVAASADPATKAYERGKACVGKKDFDAAIVAFTEAIRLDPKFAEAYYERGNVYYNTGERDKAIADFTDAIRLNPKHSEAYCG